MQYSLALQLDTHSHRAVQTESAMDMLTEEQLQASFDANGNPLWLNSGKHPLAWDSRNQLKGFTLLARANHDDDVERYSYDASGQRRQKTYIHYAENQQHTQSTRYLPGLEFREIEQQDRDGKNLKIKEKLHLLTFNAGPVTVRLFHWESGKPEKITDNDIRHYALENHLGSTQLQVDHNAEIVSYEEYYPYGGTAMTSCRNKVETDYHVIRYSGKERDRSGLYYYGARYYAPWLGRWLNPDPVGTIDGLNLFRMVDNNPITFLDTGGLTSTSFQGNNNTEPASSRSLDWRIESIGNLTLYQSDIKDTVNFQKKGLLIFAHGGLPYLRLFKSVVPKDTDVHFFVKHGELASSSMARAQASDTSTLETITSGQKIHNYELGSAEEGEIRFFQEALERKVRFHNRKGPASQYYDLLVVREGKRASFKKALQVAEQKGYKQVYTHSCRGRIFPRFVPLAVRRRLHDFRKYLNRFVPQDSRVVE